MFKIISAGFALAFFIAAPFNPAFTGNLIETGNFDRDGWVLFDGAEIQGDVFLDGEKALLLPGPQYTRAFTTAPGPEPGQFYRVDAWCMTKGMPEEPEGFASVYMDGVGSFMANLDNHGWEPVTAWFRAGDDKPFRIHLLRRGIPEGKVFFDNVSLRRCPDPNLDVVDFEDGTTIGIHFSHSPTALARVVDGSGPGGGEHSLFASRATLHYRLAEPLASGRAEFDFTLKLNGRGRMDIGPLRIDLSPQIVNSELRDGEIKRQPLGSFIPGRWYRFRGIIDLDSQRYNLEVTDFEDEIHSFSRRNLLFSGPMDEIAALRLTAPREGGNFDNIYLGSPRE